mgnify:CR=1 FL=1
MYARNGVIDEPTFSFHMTNQSGTSYIDFGTPDASITGANYENVHWVDSQLDSPWWTGEVKSFKWGEGMED